MYNNQCLQHICTWHQVSHTIFFRKRITNPASTSINVHSHLLQSLRKKEYSWSLKQTKNGAGDLLKLLKDHTFTSDLWKETGPQRGYTLNSAADAPTKFGYTSNSAVDAPTKFGP